MRVWEAVFKGFVSKHVFLSSLAIDRIILDNQTINIKLIGCMMMLKKLIFYDGSNYCIQNLKRWYHDKARNIALMSAVLPS